MPKPFFHDEQHLLPCLDHEKAFGLQPNQCKRRWKKIAMSRNPENRPTNACKEATNHERGRSPLLGVRPGTADLVQRT
jgi:hypothetical protein